MTEADHEVEAQRWLRYAEEDLATARAVAAGDTGVPRHACWLAQQAAEKSIKAALVYSSVDFPRSHDLDRLCNLVPAHWQIAKQAPDLAELAQWATEARYPGEWSDGTPQDAASAVAAAEEVVRLIGGDLKKQGGDT